MYGLVVKQTHRKRDITVTTKEREINFWKTEFILCVIQLRVQSRPILFRASSVSMSQMCYNQPLISISLKDELKKLWKCRVVQGQNIICEFVCEIKTVGQLFASRFEESLSKFCMENKLASSRLCTHNICPNLDKDHNPTSNMRQV